MAGRQRSPRPPRPCLAGELPGRGHEESQPRFARGGRRARGTPRCGAESPPHLEGAIVGAGRVGTTLAYTCLARGRPSMCKANRRVAAGGPAGDARAGRGLRPGPRALRHRGEHVRRPSGLARCRERTSNPCWSLPPIAPACGSGNDCQVRCARGGVRPFTALGARRVTEGRGGGRSEEGWVTVAADQNRSAMPTAPGSGWPFARSPT